LATAGSLREGVKQRIATPKLATATPTNKRKEGSLLGREENENPAFTKLNPPRSVRPLVARVRVFSISYQRGVSFRVLGRRFQSGLDVAEDAEVVIKILSKFRF
jgi:hypothetical protein